VRKVGREQWNDTRHFVAYAATTMRNVIIDHLRSNGRAMITLDTRNAPIESGGVKLDLIALDDALCALAGLHPRQVQVVELRFFGGLELREIADVLGVSLATVKLDWRDARTWLHQKLNSGKAL
jgi:RNA polymerase sigma factor (TIGR02999 family)